MAETNGEIITPERASELQEETRQREEVLVWTVLHNTDNSTYRAQSHCMRQDETTTEMPPYVVVAPTLNELHAMLPKGLKVIRFDFGGTNPDVVEVWL